MKKALAILGSPRKRGNAAGLLDMAAEQARQAGYDVEKFDLYEHSIGWCRGCMSCKKTGLCVIEDDIVPVRERLRTCDLIILSAPTYFANVPAPVKNMFDRLVGAVMDDNNSTIPKPRLSAGQKYLLLTTCNTPFPFDRLGGQSSGCIKAMKEVFHISGMKCMGTVVYAGTRGKTEIPPKVVKQLKRCFT